MQQRDIVDRLGRRRFLKAGLAVGAGALVGPALLPRAAAAAETFLLVRANLVDVGVRPVYPFWESPDVVPSPTDAWGRVAAGTNVSVSVIVENLGKATATNVRATFWWANPSVAITPGTVNLIGASAPVSIAGGTSRTLTSTTPWVPVIVNDGHECLIVEIDSDQESPTSFLPEYDRRMAQRNETVFGVMTDWHLPLEVAMPFPDPLGPIELRVATRYVRNAERLLRQQLPFSPADLLVHIDEPPAAEIARELGLVVEAAEPGVGVQLLGVKDSDLNAGGLSDGDLKLLAQGAPGPADFGTTLAKIDLPGYGVANAILAFDHKGPADAAIVHDFRELIDGIGIGGKALVLPPTV